MMKRTFYYSGARAAIMWVCVLGLFIDFVLGPIFTFIALCLHSPAVFPMLHTDTLLSLAGVVLGMGGLRTAEKFKGVASQ